jgi:hypothetical protein
MKGVAGEEAWVMCSGMRLSQSVWGIEEAAIMREAWREVKVVCLGRFCYGCLVVSEVIKSCMACYFWCWLWCRVPSQGVGLLWRGLVGAEIMNATGPTMSKLRTMSEAVVVNLRGPC